MRRVQKWGETPGRAGKRKGQRRKQDAFHSYEPSVIFIVDKEIQEISAPPHRLESVMDEDTSYIPIFRFERREQILSRCGDVGDGKDSSLGD